MLKVTDAGKRTLLVDASDWCNADVNLLFNIEGYMGN